MEQIEKYKSIEISLSGDYSNIREIEDHEVDVVFTHEYGKSLKVPAFWDIEDFRVRFSPMEIGKWHYESTDGHTGDIECVEYSGDLLIYKNGWPLKTEEKHLTYNNGTPFFYLGDTHWTILFEDFETMFKPCVDKRVEQEFTVYQTQPIASEDMMTFDNGIKNSTILGLRELDKRFKYIAEKGLVNANAELIFPNKINPRFYDPKHLRAMIRHWIARYASYPVIWTLGQTIDSKCYGKYGFDVDNNPYKLMCDLITEIDPYHHLITAHQELHMWTSCHGNVENDEFKGVFSRPSIFLNNDNHKLFAAQYKPKIDKPIYFDYPKDYWKSNKPAINYESFYDHLATNRFGERAQAWISMLNGFCGFGYGAQTLWHVTSNYGKDVERCDDGTNLVTISDKNISFNDAMNLDSANDMFIVKSILEQHTWWDLEPCFDDCTYFSCNSLGCCAHISNRLYIAYLWGNEENVDMSFNGISSKKYRVYCIDPSNGTILGMFCVQSDQESDNLSLKIDSKLTKSDAVIIVEEIQ